MVKKRNLSPEQDLAANPLENVWVQANAGTGKTSVLVQRLLRILFRNPDCAHSGILCLTYTNAGAGEMRNRILSSLREWALASDDDLIDMLNGITVNKPATMADVLHAREIFFKYIDAPEILKIKTIHGFCEEILHRFPLEAGIAPAWSLVSDAAQRVLLQDAFNKLVNSPSDDQKVFNAFSHIVGRVSETYMSDLLKILSAQYKQFFQVKDIVNYRKQFVDTTKKYLNITIVPSADFNAEKLKKIAKTAIEEQNNAKKPAKYLNDIVNLIEQYIDTTIDFEKYKTAYLTADGNIKSVVSKKDYLLEEAHRVYELNQFYNNKLLFEDTLALFDLSAAFANEYQKLKRARNLLDFEDLILYTRKLFSDSSTMGWVLSQLDLSLSHILVDEAQDTSPLQWDILRMLAGDFFADGSTDKNARSLFVVGDTKQSIYGFQGADPRAFSLSRDAIREQIAHNLRTIREIPLAQSFRSSASILYAVDKFFADSGVVELSSFANNPHKCFRADVPGIVELHKLVAKQESDTDVRSYIKNIANKIKEIIDSGRHKAHDIMVLVQNRNPMASPLVSELKKLDIDVAGSDRIVLPNFPAIRDLLNLVRWCLNTDDDYSLCCVLKSPFFYMKEHDIFNLCKIKNTDKKTVFSVLADTNPDVYERLNQIYEWSKDLAPYSFFTNVLNSENTREKLISALGNQIVDPLEEFLTICLSYERTQPGTLYQFLKWFITGGSEIKRDMDASSGVRVVTVHGSKGLEAPVVFLIDTVRTPKPENILPISSDDAMPIWLWAPRSDDSAIRAKATDEQMNIRMAEYYRLLYVAMTRARDELYIYGFTPRKNASPTSWHSQLWRVFANNTDAEYIRITNDDIK